MRVVNKLTKPGDVCRIDLALDTVHVQTSDGYERIYRIVSIERKEERNGRVYRSAINS